MEINTNSEYKVIELDKYGGKLSINSRKFRNLKKNEILVKIMLTTIHPADLMFLMGEYGDEKPNVFPLVPGFEGSGEIVQVSENMDKKLIGKRVCLSSPFKKDGTFEGLWAEYNYTSLSNVMVFDNKIPYEKITFSFINPMTAIGFLDTLRKNDQNKQTHSVIQDGASGALGKMFIRLCAREGVNTINIVRNPNYILDLKKLGADHVISTQQSEWEQELQQIAKELNAKIFFDCVGGNQPGKILSLLPNGAVLYNFGNLEIKKLGIDSSSLIFKNKSIHGWWLLNWLKTLTPEERYKWWDYVIKDIKSGSDLFLTKVSKNFSLKQIYEAINYYQKNMSEGKVLLSPKF
jgi:NADPH:quinone reductase